MVFTLFVINKCLESKNPKQNLEWRIFYFLENVPVVITDAWNGKLITMEKYICIFKTTSFSCFLQFYSLFNNTLITYQKKKKKVQF